MDPAFAAAVCRYDLSNGPLKLTAPVSPAYTSVSFYTRRGVAYYAINDRAAGRRVIELDLMTTAQRAELPEDEEVTAADRLIVELPTDTGLIVMRALAPEPGLMPMPRVRAPRRVASLPAQRSHASEQIAASALISRDLDAVAADALLQQRQRRARPRPPPATAPRSPAARARSDRTPRARRSEPCTQRTIARFSAMRWSVLARSSARQLGDIGQALARACDPCRRHSARRRRTDRAAPRRCGCPRSACCSARSASDRRSWNSREA